MALELLKTHNHETPAPSASVVPLRDAADGLEVFLLRRHVQSAVLGGAYVFPGGKVDAEDVEWIDRVDQPVRELHALLGEPELAPEIAAGLYVTAIRELFEETGLLLANVTPRQASEAWAALRSGPRFDELLSPMDLTLATSLLQPWSRWVTPTLSSVGRKRFDTRFFLATVPAGQQARHDEHEATEGVWLTPRAALQQYWEGQIDLAPPQIIGLAHLARHSDVAAAFEAARARTPPCIRPEPREVDGTRVLCYPGDPGHSVAQRALPGPTRLTWRNGRFEPDGGLPALLAD